MLILSGIDLDVARGGPTDDYVSVKAAEEGVQYLFQRGRRVKR